MKSVESAIEKGRCVLAVGGAVLRDAEIALAIAKRPGLPSIPLSGPANQPLVALNAENLHRVTGQQGGVVIVVEPQNEDTAGMKKLGELLRSGAHKPAVVFAARDYNAFTWMGALQGLKVEHNKTRANAFLKGLPIPAVVEPPPAPEKPAGEEASKAPSDGARFCFVGREEEVASLAALLGTGGPVVVSGPRGVGRTQLVEHAISAAGLKRLPDYELSPGSGFDGLVSLLVAATEEAGVKTLGDAVRAHQTPPEIVKAAVAALSEANGLDGHAFVVHSLQFAMGREGDFFRKSRLELLVLALLTNAYPLRVVFVSTHQPVLFREGAGAALRRVEVAGIKGRFYHEIFEALGAPEFPRERFGPISERTHGNPMAARLFAVAVRDRQDGLALTEDPKFLAAEEPNDNAGMLKALQKKLEKLQDAQREAVIGLAHFRTPIDGKLLADLNVNKKLRSELLRLGLLDMVGTLESKRYRVHPMVRRALPRRATEDFDVLRVVAQAAGVRAKDTTGIEQVAWAHWSTWGADLGRDPRAAFRGQLPDDDAHLESTIGLIRREEPKLDLAEKLVRQALSRNPANSDAHLLLLEILDRGNATNEALTQAFEDAVKSAPVPEVYHQVVGFWLRRKARPKAIAVLEQAVATLPEESRLRARLASLLLRQGRRPEAIDHLKRVMELDPMLPDAYGLLGMARLDEGVGALTEAETLIREAVRLAPKDPIQVSRLAGLLLDKGRIAELDQRDALWDEAQKLLDEVMVTDKESPHAVLLLASLVRLRGQDFDRARWLVEQAKKRTDRQSERRLRVRLEAALIDLATGKLDDAERGLRDLAEKDPSNHEVFAGLAQVLVARDLLVPAHAEYLRARERTPASSIARLEYETELTRLQERIEAQAAAMLAGPPVAVDGPSSASSGPRIGSGSKVVRRRKGADEAESSDAEAADATPVEAAPPAVEGADADAS
jgi:tetratricopeptide (TPR) repeat protein